MDAIVTDRFDYSHLSEAQAWQQVANTLQKPFMQRSEDEVSLFMTLLTNLEYVRENELSMQTRMTMCKSASLVTIDPGTIMLEKTEEHADAYEFRRNPEKFRTAPTAATTNHNNSNNTILTNNEKVESTPSPQTPTTAAKSVTFSSSKPSSSINTTTATTAKPPSSTATTTTTTNTASSGKLPQHLGTEMQELQQRYDRVIQGIPFCLLVRGRLVLERRTPNGRVRTEIPRGSAIGDDLTFESLPVGSAYIATETTEVIGLNHDIYSMYLAADCEQREIFRRIHYFTSQMIIPIFEPWYSTSAATDNKNTTTASSSTTEVDGGGVDGTTQPLYRQISELLQRLSPDQCSKLNALAVSVYPLHFGGKEIAVREGQLSDDVFFIVSGRMKVVRQVNFTVHASSPSVKLLELATLEPGEYFGELGLLRHDVDVAKSVSVESLLQVTEAEIDEEDPEREMLVIESSTPSKRRQATVYAHTPSVCYVLPRESFIENVQQGPLVRMREYAKGYPSTHTIQQHFLKKQEWNTFKTAVFEKHHPQGGGRAMDEGGGGGGSGAGVTANE